jgi:hypothetical protein
MVNAGPKEQIYQAVPLLKIPQRFPLPRKKNPNTFQGL